MKLLSVLMTACLCLSSTLPSFGQTQEEPSRWYLRADAGGQITDDVDLEEFLGPVSPGSTLSLSPGMRLGLAGGYEVTDWFSAEVSAGFQYSSIDDVTGATDVDGRLSNYPVLAGGRFQYKNSSAFTPYAGAALGLAATSLNLDDLTIGGTTVDGIDFDMVFAWQLFAGLEYKLNDKISIGLAYHFVMSDGAEYEADGITSTGGSDKLKLGDVSTHNFSLTFSLHF